MAELTADNFKKVLDQGFEKQAVLINSAFQNQKDHFDQQVHKLDGKIELARDELKTDISRVEAKLDRALYTEVTHLEARLKRVEQKLGIKPTA